MNGAQSLKPGSSKKKCHSMQHLFSSFHPFLGPPAERQGSDRFLQAPKAQRRLGGNACLWIISPWIPYKSKAYLTYQSRWGNFARKRHLALLNLLVSLKLDIHIVLQITASCQNLPWDIYVLPKFGKAWVHFQSEPVFTMQAWTSDRTHLAM